MLMVSTGVMMLAIAVAVVRCCDGRGAAISGLVIDSASFD